MIANAVAYPRTMMIHFRYAYATVGAMVCSLRLPSSALMAHVYILALRHRWYLPWLSYAGDPIAEERPKATEVQHTLPYKPVHFIVYPVKHLAIISNIQGTDIQKWNQYSHSMYEGASLHALAAHFSEKLMATFTQVIHIRFLYFEK